MLGPINAMDVARTSIKLRDPVLKLAGAVMRYSLPSVVPFPMDWGNNSKPRPCGRPTAKHRRGPPVKLHRRNHPAMKRLIPAATLVLASLAWAAPAFAKDFVQDQAGMFSAGTVAALNQK